MTELFVERSFQAPNGQVLARFERPYLAPGGEYRCRWRIVGLGADRGKETAGIDSVQALMLAMKVVQAELSESDEYKAGKLTYLEQTDLDLPSLYDAGPSPTE